MFAWLLHNAVLAAALALAVALLCRWRRIGPSLRHALWVLVLLRLVMPPGVLNWPWQVPLPKPAEQTQVVEIATNQETFGTFDGIEVRTLEPVEFAPAIASDDHVAMPQPEPIRWSVVGWWTLFAAWLIGTLVVASRHLHGLLKLTRVVRGAHAATPALLRHVGETAAKLGIRPPRVRVVPGLGSPLVAGLPRPVLLWPTELLHRLDDDGMKAVMIHELAHLRRRDHWVRWLEMAAACLWWWNPLFRLARRRVRQYAELACDAWVLRVMPRARRAYAEALLKVCETVATTPEPAAALGVGGEPADFQRRLTMIMREPATSHSPRRALLAVGALALLAIPGWTLGEPPAPAAPDVPELAGRAAIDDIADLFEFDIAQLDQAPDRDEKLADIEAQIRALLTEIQALKGDKVKSNLSTTRAATKALTELAQQQAQNAEARKAAESKLYERVQQQAGAARAASRPGDLVLYRVIYPLNQSRGDALAKFLKDAVKLSVLEAAVDGDKITITATPEHQQVVARLIQLISDLPAKSSAKK